EKNDTSVYHLAPGFSIDNIPEPVEIDNSYGYYKREIIADKGTNSIKVIARLVLKNRIIPTGDYKKVADFFAEVNSDEGQKIVLKKE
ncbi:MAG TPA: hypothetical protein VGO09_02825, partial [Flavisolibacter sp.]|nr:hypothetical protein [Flavisolibacter sp.]